MLHRGDSQRSLGVLGLLSLRHPCTHGPCSASTLRSPSTAGTSALPQAQVRLATLPAARGSRGFQVLPPRIRHVLVNCTCSDVFLGDVRVACALPSTTARSCSHYGVALRLCCPCLARTKPCSTVSWSGPACPLVFPAPASASACCPALPRAPSFSVCRLFFSLPASPLSLLLLLPRPPFLLRPPLLPRLLPFPAPPFPLPRLFLCPSSFRLCLSLFCFVVSVMLVVLLGRPGLLSSPLPASPAAAKLVPSTFTEH